MLKILITRHLTKILLTIISIFDICINDGQLWILLWIMYGYYKLSIE